MKLAVALSVLASLFLPTLAEAHCDSLDGPVVAGAKAALSSGDAKAALAWVPEADEAEVLRALERARSVRGTSREVREIVDTWFFETVVRLHRKGEGEPYTGLRPAGSAPAVIVETDRAIARGDASALEAELSAAVRAGFHERFDRVLEARKTAGTDTQSARRYTDAYVELVHFVEVVAGASEEAEHPHF